MKKNITLITTSRADWSYALPLAKTIKASVKLNLQLVVTGSHFLKDYGYTYKDILNSGFRIDRRIPIGYASDTAPNISHSLGIYVQKFSKEFISLSPDLIVLFGDRIEILSIALSALPFRIPLAHIGGGDFTQGAVDEGVRHAMTKLSHMHFVSTAPAKEVIEQMGEESWRVHHTGSLAIDSISAIKPYDLTTLQRKIPFIGERNFLLVTLHPQTIGSMSTDAQIRCVLKSLKISALPVVFTYPNIDMANKTIIAAIETYVRSHQHSIIIKNAGTRLYYSLVRCAAAVVGNSSSGIYDTPFLCTPAVNIGDRQLGRLKAGNVIDVEFNSIKIVKAIKRACSSQFCRALSKQDTHFFGNGRAADRIVRILERAHYEDLLYKRFNKSYKR